MTNSELFTKAHNLTKATIKAGDNYAITFGACLKFIRSQGNKMINRPTFRMIRSSTGMYHLGENNMSHCNGRSGRFNPAKPSDVLKAKTTSFCKKCFPNGPERYINNMGEKGLVTL